MLPRTIALAATLLSLSTAFESEARADEKPAPEKPAPEKPAAENPASEKPERTLFVVPLQRGMNRVQGTLRPFINMINPGVGLIADISGEHYFEAPYKLGVEVSPLALVSVQEGLGAIAHIRVRGAFVTDGLEVGLGVGGRYQHYGPSGMSFSPSLRIGWLDGFNMRLELTHSLIRNYYTGLIQFAWASSTLGIDVPVTKKLALTLDGSYGSDLWIFGALGARHFVTGNGGPGTLIIGASFGIIYLADRFKCQYTDQTPCESAPTALGPAIAVRVDRRF